MNCAALEVEIALRWTSKYRCDGCAPAQCKCAALETALANTASEYNNINKLNLTLAIID